MWNCETCIHKNKLGIKEEMCERHCKDCFNRIGRENADYQKEIPKPSNCSLCEYCHTTYNGDILCSVSIYDYDDNDNKLMPIRKNYLAKNTPKWCQLK